MFTCLFHYLNDKQTFLVVTNCFLSSKHLKFNPNFDHVLPKNKLGSNHGFNPSYFTQISSFLSIFRIKRNKCKKKSCEFPSAFDVKHQKTPIDKILIAQIHKYCRVFFRLILLTVFPLIWNKYQRLQSFNKFVDGPNIKKCPFC